MNKKVIFILITIPCLFFAGRFTAPKQIEVHKEIDTKLMNDKINEVKKEYENQQNNITTTTKTIKKDGTITFTSKIDKSHSFGVKNIVTNETKTEKDTKKIENKTTVYNTQPNWYLHSTYTIPLKLQEIQQLDKFDYKNLNIGLDYRILGNIYFSNNFTLEPSLSLGLGIAL